MKIHSLHYYPVKALAGHSPQSWTLEPRGFRHDRRWMFVDEAGNFMSQRKNPAFVHWQASVEEEDLVISHRTDVNKTYRISQAMRSDRPQVTVTLWDDTFTAGWIDDPIVKQLIAEMNIGSARLVYMSEENRRLIDPRYGKATETVSLADGYPYLITNTASLEDANERMKESLQMSRFRPNIVLSSTTPWAEDDWQKLSIGTTTFRLPKPCARCRVITIDQETGEQRIELLGALSRFRKVDQKILFGVNAIWESGDPEIRVGDVVGL